MSIQWLIDNYVIDIWSLAHFAIWMFCGMFCIWEYTLTFKQTLVIGLFSAYWWECMEPMLFAIYGSRFGEPPLNSWVADPVCDMIGVLTAFGIVRIAKSGHSA